MQFTRGEKRKALDSSFAIKKLKHPCTARTGNTSLDVPGNGTPFFGSQTYNDIDPATKNLEMYLQQFPSIKDIPVIHTRPSGDLPNIQYGMGQFNMAPKSPGKILVGEIAPSYLHMDGASKRISSTMPEMKAVFIFRDPIERAYLNYLAQSKPSRKEI